MARTKKQYGLGSFLFDVIFGIITCGIWWVWLILKFLRSNS